MHLHQWHPNGTRNQTSFTWWKQPSAANTVREWHQMAPTVGALTATSRGVQPLYLDFLPQYVERATRIELAFSAWEKKGGQPNAGEPQRCLTAGQTVIHTLANNHERQRPRDIRGMRSYCKKGPPGALN
jgi:hypothetical protein